MIALWIVVGILVLILLGGVLSYNRFVSQRNLIRNAFANIDTELRRRYDLIPNLVETVKGYAAHERGVFEEVARTRSAAAAATGSPQEQAAAEGPFVQALRQLFAVAENYPDLKANQNFLALQQELANTEDRIVTHRSSMSAGIIRTLRSTPIRDPACRCRSASGCSGCDRRTAWSETIGPCGRRSGRRRLQTALSRSG